MYEVPERTENQPTEEFIKAVKIGVLKQLCNEGLLKEEQLYELIKMQEE